MNEPDAAPGTVAERLTDQFYQWELRGRGWQVWPAPVDLEPPFRPFVGHYIPPTTIADDGKFETGWSEFADSLFRRLGVKKESAAIPPVILEDEPVVPRVIRDREGLVELQAVLPAELDIPREAFEKFVGSLHLCREPVTFDLLGRPSMISAQFVADTNDMPLVGQQLQAFFPDATFLPQQESLAKAWGEGESVIVEFGLGKEFMLPLASGRLDPFVGIIGALSELRADELGLFQVILQPVRHPWAESVLRAVTDNMGGAVFRQRPRTRAPRSGESRLAALCGGRARGDPERRVRAGLGDRAEPRRFPLGLRSSDRE